MHNIVIKMPNDVKMLSARVLATNDQERILGRRAAFQPPGPGLVQRRRALSGISSTREERKIHPLGLALGDDQREGYASQKL
jgi:hypothetical protein